MKYGRIASVVVIAVMASLPAFAQSDASRGTAAGGPSNMGRGLLNQDQFDKLSDFATRAKRLTKEDKANGKTLEQVLAEDKAAATALTKAMPLSCEVTDALKIAEGPATVDGKSVQTTTYEAACTNGMGYLLIAQEPAKPSGFSCFAYDATAKADAAIGKKDSEVCRLPTNADLKIVAAKMLAGAGFTCKVKDFRYAGQSAASHVEFDEVACDDGKGYFMVVALPGSVNPVRVETCNQSAKRGLPCKLSDNGDIGPTRASFRESLIRNHVVCDATDSTTRVVGEITTKKQYVVEFACPQMPKGLIAYIPQPGSIASFEAVDCPTAAKRGAVCTLPENHK